ncbi:MAG TPA: hypothetical protein PLG50_08510 [bacterium]|nr:hypothetical protein [bacterium]HQG45687.1 hypothetical protein [bacterium]HQI48489.1 hypothetical protein [bacterium]HQJ65783.1 hypothetical protein [bacterium]
MYPRSLFQLVSLLMLCALFVPIYFLWATVPAPPVQVQISMGLEKPVILRAIDREFPVQVMVFFLPHLDEKALKKFDRGLLLRVTMQPIDPTQRTKAERLFERRISYSKDTLTVAIPLPLFMADKADLEVEFWIGPVDGDGAIDRQIRYLIKGSDGTLLFMTPKQYQTKRHQDRYLRFEEQRRREPDNPDIRLLWDTTRKIDDRQVISPFSTEQQLLVDPVGPADALRPYYRSHSTERKKTDPLTIKGRVVYTDFEGTQRPLPIVSIDIYDSDWGLDEHLGTVLTNYNGDWSFSCDNDDGIGADGRDIYYTFKLENSRMRIQDCGPWPDVTYTYESATHDDLDDGTILDFGTETGSGDMGPMIVWGFEVRAWNHAVKTGKQDPGFVDTCFPENGTHWDRYWEEIDYEQGYTDGPDIYLHEYGHAIMYYAYGENSPSPGGYHDFTQVTQNEGLAWSEGWGTGWMLSLWPDGIYDWHEGTTESAGEYPTGTLQLDTGGESIEYYSSSNRSGYLNEGRVAAAINDMLDSHNDNNGGDTDIGRSDRSDANSSYRVTLDLMMHNTLWGSYHNNFLEFYNSLTGELGSLEWNEALQACQYNWMALADPIILCVATRIVTGDMAGRGEIFDGLKKFRDLGLKSYDGGRQLAQLYYRHSPELAFIFLQNMALKEEALKVLDHFARIGHALANNKSQNELFRVEAPVIPVDLEAVIDHLLQEIEKNAGEKLKSDLIDVKSYYRSVRGLTFRQLSQRMEDKAQFKGDRSGRSIKPMDISPDSQERLRLLDLHLPKTEMEKKQ